MQQFTVVSVLINRGDQYLFIKQDKPGGAYQGTLHIPGGRVEAGENPEEAIRRETFEEVGLELTDLEPADFDWDEIVYKGQPTRFTFLRFTASSEKGEPVAGSDAVEVVWVSREDLSNQIHNGPTKKLLKRLQLM